MANVLTPWPHQPTGVSDVLTAFKAGIRRVALTTPTGGGKTRMMEDLAREYLDNDLKVVLYSSRRLLIEQLKRGLTESGFDFGVRAAGHADERYKNFQVSSFATENARTPEAIFMRARKSGSSREEAEFLAAQQRIRWELHDADLVLVDEAHLHKSGGAQKLLNTHYRAGAYTAGFTATPIGLYDMYDQLIIAGTMSELRACKALLPCRVYGPDEPDLGANFNKIASKDLSENEIEKLIGKGKVLFGRVWENWKLLNPDARPTILFASGVEESLWFAEEFSKRGVRSAHIDGEHIWMTGWDKPRPTTADLRAEVLEESKHGRIKLLTNRYVFREGIDAPWLYHGILATVIGSLQSYLQCVGRLLRFHPSMAHVILQDHGGHWWRHGSPNADRAWDLRLTATIVSQLRREGILNGSHKEPWRCRNCRAIMQGTKCAFCGWIFDPTKRSRPVAQSDGTLRELEGCIFKPRRSYTQPDAADKWKQMYFRARNSQMTFNQAVSFFASMHYWQYPSRSLPLMPYDDFDLFRKVRDVDPSRLIDSRLPR